MTRCNFCPLIGEQCTAEEGRCQRKLQMLKVRLDDCNDRTEEGPSSDRPVNLNASLPVTTSGSTIFEPVQRLFSSETCRRRRHSEVSNRQVTWRNSSEHFKKIEGSGGRSSKTTPGSVGSSVSNPSESQVSSAEQQHLDVDLRRLKPQMSAKRFPKTARKQNDTRQRCISFLCDSMGHDGTSHFENSNNSNQTIDRTRALNTVSEVVDVQLCKTNPTQVKRRDEISSRKEPLDCAGARTVSEVVMVKLDKMNVGEEEQGKEISSRNEQSGCAGMMTEDVIGTGSASGAGNLDDRHANAPDTAPSLDKTIDRSSGADGNRLSIFTSLHEVLGKALQVFDQEALGGQNEFVSLFKTESMESETSVLQKFDEIRKIVEKGLVSTGSHEPVLPSKCFHSMFTNPDETPLRALSNTPTNTRSSPETCSLRSFRKSPETCSLSSFRRSPDTCSLRSFRSGQVESPTVDLGCDSNQTQDVHVPTLASTPRRSRDKRVSTIDEDENPLQSTIPIGIFNRDGKVCFVNASLQLLSAVPEMLEIIKKGMDSLKRMNTRFNACNAYKTFMESRKRAMTNPRRVPILSKHLAQVMFKKYPTIFKAGQQHDCAEFVAKFLESIHNELGAEFSPLQLFKGVQRRFCSPEPVPTDETSGSSNQPTNKVEEFTTIHLHLTSQDNVLEDCFHAYTSEQRCPETKTLHWCKFEALPRWLLVQIQSYDESTWQPQKAHRKVCLVEKLQFRDEWMYSAPGAEEVPVPSDEGGVAANLSSSAECASSSSDSDVPAPSVAGSGVTNPEESSSSGSEDSSLYLLRAVVFHTGDDTTSGHYTTAVSVPSKESRFWYLCNDERVSRHTLSQLDKLATTEQVTLLLFERDC